MASQLLRRSFLRCRTCRGVLRHVQTRSSSTKSSPATIFSGIQPTGIPHLGNYLGAIQNWIRLQNTASSQDTLVYSIVGWHALTLPQDPGRLYEAKYETLASLLAFGIDPERCIVFSQDDVSEHLALSWILTCLTPTGRLKRMTTWKSKLATARNANSEFEVDDSMLNLGLFSYPVLQAADVLIYRATHVPVGEDQTQHLELSRDLAELFNRKYPDRTTLSKDPLFPLPHTIYTPSRRILSLRDPTQKMSKSAPDVNSRIMLTDPPATITKKIRSAVTDSTHGITYDPAARPGVANLLAILTSFRSLSEINSSPSDPVQGVEATATDYAGKGAGELKSAVADAIVEAWRRPREELDRLRRDRGYLDQVFENGNRRAKALSSVTLARAKERIGLAEAK